MFPSKLQDLLNYLISKQRVSTAAGAWSSATAILTQNSKLTTSSFLEKEAIQFLTIPPDFHFTLEPPTQMFKLHFTRSKMCCTSTRQRWYKLQTLRFMSLQFPAKENVLFSRKE